MHFTYTENLCTTELCQGDVLERTPDIDALLELVHPHFYKKESNLFFMVLTQSCDLVPRSNGNCKASYITIAPVRPIDIVLSRQVSGLQADGIQANAPVLTDKSKSKLSEFLQRLYNNNEPGLFFLEASGTILPSDCCVYLNLSIAIKSMEHYQKCVDAKRLQLSDTFQAKLGWLVGQMYSRVGTDDWDSNALKKKIQLALENIAIWIPEASAKPLSKILKDREVDAGEVNEKVIKEALTLIPTKKSLIVQQVESVGAKVLANELSDYPPQISASVLRALMKRLDGDAGFTSLTK